MQDSRRVPLHVIVVGGGLFGAATARYLAESGQRVTSVASPEPTDPTYAGAADAGADPMASHYDQGRIVRSGGSDGFGAASVRRYPELARRSGVPFFRPHPVVTLTAGPVSGAGFGTGVADVRPIELQDLADSTGIVAPPGFDGAALIETSTAGIVNPRMLVKAQLALAQAAGAEVVSDHAVGVDLTTTSGRVRVDTASGTSVEADQLVLATGAYGAELVGLRRPIQRRLRTIALIEVEGPTDELPSLSAEGFLHPVDDDEPKLEEMYWVPPVQYPDGGIYLKIGGNSLPMITASDNGDIGRWFKAGGSAAEANALFLLAADLLPKRRLRLAGYKPCVVSYTEDEKPIIERVGERVVLALAGNGSGATTGDEVGRRAAELAVDPGAEITAEIKS